MLMQALKIHQAIVEDYKSYLNSFTNISDPRIQETVQEAFRNGLFLPEPLLQFNPSFELGESLQELEKQGLIHGDLKKIFGSYNLHHHQVEAIKKGVAGEGFIVTSGTGSGKSLTYLASIFNNILETGNSEGVKAIIVYPMNALINSQEEEIRKYEINYLKSFVPNLPPEVLDEKSPEEALALLKTMTAQRFPVSYAKYTGQEQGEVREKVRETRPSVILTNYMMLELIMTRNGEGWLREAMRKNLEYLVFDELHTYRGRQGADVSLLIRRIRQLVGRPLIAIGTSATLASQGSPEERKMKIAEVAGKIFGQSYRPDQVIGEKLRSVTEFNGAIPSGFDLQEAMAQPFVLNHESFYQNPLSIWLENRIALKRHRDGYVERATPLTLEAIAEQLSQDSGDSIDNSREAVRRFLEWIEQLNADADSKTAACLPFKIHQFIAQTGNVYVTLDDRNSREITLQTNRYIRKEGQDRPLFPVVFSRYSGADFICVKKENGKLSPRNPDELPERITQDDLKGDRKNGIPKRELVPEDFPAGYLILSDGDQELWSDDKLEELPDNWFSVTKSGKKLKNYYEHQLPQKLFFDADGNYSITADYPFTGWFVPARLLIDPTSGVVFDRKTNENTKVMRIGNEGRSTATTIMSFSIVKALQNAGIPPQNRKLLSFTDNRQDASLQAGHFNDFMMLGMLRSAIYHALKEAPEKRLTIDTISDAVFRKLNLSESEYARNPSSDPSWPDPENEKAIKDYLLVRILYDLKRGWRYNTPNLEQCALLNIGFNRLREFSERETFFEPIPRLREMTPQERYDVLLQVLNFFRTSYAFEYYKLTDKRVETEERLKNRLDENKLWSLEQDEKIDSPYILLPQSVGEVSFRLYTASAGTQSYLGKYIRRLTSRSASGALHGDDLITVIESICSLLERGHFLRSEKVSGSNGEKIGYRLRIDSLYWELGNGHNVVADEVRIQSMNGAVRRTPNDFFRKFYQQNFNAFGKTLSGREHTGQLNHEQRIERENGFRQGDIAALFCSPTMELGIDIRELNVVHMRNVPPNPANYAQRSGRAGRSGQAALIFTYCSNGSPHDRNYFSESERMVAGSVVPPTIDLTNEELVKSHFNAYILMELGLRDMGSSVDDVLEVMQMPELPLKPDLEAYIQEQLDNRAYQWAHEFREIIAALNGVQETCWFSEEWFMTNARGFLKQFNDSFDRWRSLYRSANRLIEVSRAIIDDPSIAGDNQKKNNAERDERIGKRQRELLLNVNRRSFGNDSEFYVFRYLAAEGFLPGYNFTRLPIRAFLGYRHKDAGEFVSRPRFIALKEFGPNNFIYHNGGKYRITRMQSVQTELNLRSVKISRRTGYALLDDDAKGVNNDPITREELNGQDTVTLYNNLLELGESEARPQERISCEEEERSSTGFEIDQYFAFARGIDATKQVVIKDGGQPLLQVIYDQAARLIQINKKWKISKNRDDGFAIGQRSGTWKKAGELEKHDAEDPTKIVRLFTHDTADILYIQPIKELGLELDGVVSLAFAFKRALERQFQVEEGEIGVWIMGATEDKNILIYEASEGSLGILSQLIENAQQLHNLFREAYVAMHFDPDTHEDGEPDLPKATYDDLLSYYNQRYHEQLDRFAVKEPLERLMQCTIDNQQGGKTLEEQYRYLMDNYDLNSGTEKPLIEYLYKNGLLLPDKAQFNVPGCYANADFVYKTDNGFSLVFCDGSVHDKPDVQEADRRKRQCCRDTGYDVIEWHYTEPLDSLVQRRKDIFRKVR
jgi:superfamily II DNA or RNA helicase